MNMPHSPNLKGSKGGYADQSRSAHTDTAHSTPSTLSKAENGHYRAAAERTVVSPIERARRNPKSRSLALRAWCWQHEMVDENKGTPEARQQRQAAHDLYRRMRARDTSLVRVIRDICHDCLHDPEGISVRVLVRDCGVTDCGLHPVRPWQAVKGRGAQRITAHDTSLAGGKDSVSG